MNIQQFNTDKYTSGLIDYYEKKLVCYKDKQNVKCVEVGIYKGGFLQYLDQFLHSSSFIYGLDKELVTLESDRIFTFVANQSELSELKNIAKQVGYIDFVIEDGAHQYLETRNTFEAFWQYIKKGGYFFIEDWSAYTYYPDRFGSTKEIIPWLFRILSDLNPQNIEIIYNVVPKYSVIAIQK